MSQPVSGQDSGQQGERAYLFQIDVQGRFALWLELGDPYFYPVMVTGQVQEWPNNYHVHLEGIAHESWPDPSKAALNAGKTLEGIPPALLTRITLRVLEEFNKAKGAA